MFLLLLPLPGRCAFSPAAMNRVGLMVKTLNIVDACTHLKPRQRSTRQHRHDHREGYVLFEAARPRWLLSEERLWITALANTQRKTLWRLMKNLSKCYLPPLHAPYLDVRHRL
jgi:hypothetical protein